MKVPLTLRDIINNWVGSQGEIQGSDSCLKTVLQILSGYNVQAALLLSDFVSLDATCDVCL